MIYMKPYFIIVLTSVYPCITTLLRIFATLPVTTATSERSFSALKYIKNYLRSTMSDTHLNGLAHLYINRDIALNYDDVIDEFGKKKSSFAMSVNYLFRLCAFGIVRDT